MKLTRLLAIPAAAVIALTVAGTASAATVSPPPPIPGCSGGNNVVYSDYNSNWFWFSAASGGIEYLRGGSSILYDNREWCAEAISGTSWQLIKDVSSGLCLGVNGVIDIYEKPCDSSRAFDQWNSGTTPITALVIANAWWEAHKSCAQGYTAAISTDDVNDDPLIMACPDKSPTQYSTSQQWNWVKQ